MTLKPQRVFAAVLAGGESRRFGPDKALADLAGVPMVVRVGERLRAQADALAVVGHAQAAAALSAIALNDPDVPARGPLRGVLAALEWARESGADWLLTAPCDVPLLPTDLGARLLAGADRAPAVFARTEAGLHPLCAIWSCRLAEALREELEAGRHPAAHALAPDATRVLFDDETAFSNVNTPEDFARVSAKITS